MTLHDLVLRFKPLRGRQREHPAARGGCLSAHLRAWGALLITLTLAVPGIAQQSGGVVLEPSETLFGLLAARMAAGDEIGSASGTGEEGRRFVRNYLGRRKIPVSAELRAVFSESPANPDSGGRLGQCVSLALLMGPPPDYKPSAPPNSLPPDARKLLGLVPLMKSFYDQADLADLWALMQPRIQAQMDRQSPAIRHTIELSDAYLGFPSGSYLGRTYAIILSPLGPPEQVQARIYGQKYYVVVTPSRDTKVEEIRHQYLHFLLDPLAYKYSKEIEQKAQLKPSFRTAPMLAADFKEDFGLYMIESLIYAVEMRLDKRPAKETSERLQDLAAQGFILAPYFYSALLEYEKQETPMNIYLKDIIEKINIPEEKIKAAKVKFTSQPAPSASEQAPVVSREEAMLNQADNLIAEGKYVEARDVYREVLDTLDAESERALFGMAVVSSNIRKPGLAEDYFKKTLEVAEDLRIVTWSHIYLGRLYDLQTDRKRALEEYQAAALTATSFPDAYRAVQDGLDRPFGFHK